MPKTKSAPKIDAKTGEVWRPRPLFEISETLRTVMALLEQEEEAILTLGTEDGATPPTDEELVEGLRAHLESEQLALADKLNAYGWLMQELEVRRASYAAQEARFKQKARIAANQRDRMKRVVRDVFMTLDLDEVRTPDWKFKLCTNGGLVPLQVDPIQNPKELPKPFRTRTVVYEVDNDAIREHLAKGETLEFARLLERGKHIRVS